MYTCTNHNSVFPALKVIRAPAQVIKMACFLGFRGDSSISISQAVRDRTGQAAFLRDPRAGPSAQVGWRQGKVSSIFSKGRYVPVGRCPAADRGGSREAGVRGVLNGAHRAPAPCLPLLPKRGDGCPPLGVAQSPGFCLWKGGLGATAPAPGAIACVLACRLGQR